ncbi:MAG: hypothetical protein AAGC74_14590, partial [Verrucomicrobiota bacterium]
PAPPPGGGGPPPGASLVFNLPWGPLILVGVLVGRWMLVRISQKWFERVVVIFAIAAGVRLVSAGL